MIIIVLNTTNDNHSVKYLMIIIVLNTTNDNHSVKYY